MVTRPESKTPDTRPTSGLPDHLCFGQERTMSPTSTGTPKESVRLIRPDTHSGAGSAAGWCSCGSLLSLLLLVGVESGRGATSTTTVVTVLLVELLRLGLRRGVRVEGLVVQVLGPAVLAH